MGPHLTGPRGLGQDGRNGSLEEATHKLKLKEEWELARRKIEGCKGGRKEVQGHHPHLKMRKVRLRRVKFRPNFHN